MLFYCPRKVCRNVHLLGANNNYASSRVLCFFCIYVDEKIIMGLSPLSACPHACLQPINRPQPNLEDGFLQPEDLAVLILSKNILSTPKYNLSLHCLKIQLLPSPFHFHAYQVLLFCALVSKNICCT